MKNTIKVVSVVPDQPVWTAQANLGRHFCKSMKSVGVRERERRRRERQRQRRGGGLLRRVPGRLLLRGRLQARRRRRQRRRERRDNSNDKCNFEDDNKYILTTTQQFLLHRSFQTIHGDQRLYLRLLPATLTSPFLMISSLTIQTLM